MFNELHKDLFPNIFKYLRQIDLLNCKLICKIFYDEIEKYIKKTDFYKINTNELFINGMINNDIFSFLLLHNDNDVWKYRSFEINKYLCNCHDIIFNIIILDSVDSENKIHEGLGYDVYINNCLYYNKLELIKQYINNNLEQFKINYLNKKISLFILIQSEYGKINMLKYFIETHSEQTDTSKVGLNFLLERACEKCKYDIIEYLIKMGADDWNEGFAAACEGNHKNIMEYMINKGKINFDNALKRACVGGHRNIINYLINDIGVNNWNEALTGACKGRMYYGNNRNHKELIEDMINKGATECYNCTITIHIKK